MKAAMRKLCAVRNAHVGRRVLAEEVASVTACRLPAGSYFSLALFPATRAPASCVHVSLTKESAMCEAATEEVVGAPEACCKALPSNTGIDA